MHPLDFYNKKERPWPNERLSRSAIVGHTTPVSTRIWFRTKNEGKHSLILSGAPFGKPEGDPTVDIEGLELQIDHLGDSTTIPLLFAKEINSSHATDNTTVVDVPNLSPDTRYQYALIREPGNGQPNEWELGFEAGLSFTTLPDSTDAFTFGLYSCHMPYPSDYGESGFQARMWSVFQEELNYANARFVIGGGDQVYSDGNEKMSVWNWLEKVRDDNPDDLDMVSWYRDIYRGYWGIGALQSIHRNYPNYMIWDDHEIMDGWGSYAPDELSQQLDTLFRWEDPEENIALANRMKKAATQVYNEYQHSHNPPTDTAADVFDYDFTACGTDYFVLDMRGHRTFVEGGKHNILGKSQYGRFNAWAQGLMGSENKGPIFVVSPVPVVHLKDFVSNVLDWLSILGAQDDVRDHWEHDGHHEEYSEFMNLCFDTAQKTGRPLVFLSGDVHVGAIFSLKDPVHSKAKVYQVTSSAITYAALNDRSRAMLGKAVKKSGKLKVKETKNGKKEETEIVYQNHFTYVQNNIGIIDVRMDDEKTTNIYINIVGQDNDTGVTESKRIDLLKLA